MRIVLDTNILLVILSRKAKNRPVFNSFLDEEYTLCLTTEILAEYTEIIGNHMGIEYVSYFMEIIDRAENILLVTTYYRWNLIYADPDDNKFVDCAIACNAKYIVSEDKHYKVLKNISFPKVEVIGIEEFAKELNELK
jgi:putative PIN family toxin of toxin-antitoxin system